MLRRGIILHDLRSNGVIRDCPSAYCDQVNIGCFKNIQNIGDGVYFTCCDAVITQII